MLLGTCDYEAKIKKPVQYLFHENYPNHAIRPPLCQKIMNSLRLRCSNL